MPWQNDMRVVLRM